MGRYWDGAAWTAHTTPIPPGQALPELVLAVATTAPAPAAPQARPTPWGAPPTAAPGAAPAAPAQPGPQAQAAPQRSKVRTRDLMGPADTAAVRSMWTRTGIGLAIHATWIVLILTVVETVAQAYWLALLFLPGQVMFALAIRPVRQRFKQLPKGPVRSRMRLLTWVPIIPFVLVIPLNFAMVDELDRTQGNERADEVETAAATTIGMPPLACFGEPRDRFLVTPYQVVDCNEAHAGQVIAATLRTAADTDDEAFCQQAFTTVVGPRYEGHPGWWMTVPGPPDPAGNRALNCVFIHGGHYLTSSMEGRG